MPVFFVLIVAGYLAALQLVFGTACWCLAPWPWVAMSVSVLWIVCTVLSLRHPRFAGALPRGQRVLAVAVAELPALIFGTWNLLYFVGAAPRCDLGAFVLQLWLTPLAPIITLCPTGTLLNRDLWLWLISSMPFLLLALSAAVPRRPHWPLSSTKP